MTKRRCENHIIVMVEFMADHTDFARNKLRGPSGSLETARLWTKLTEMLNAVGVAKKDEKGWKTVSINIF